jgi:hypothetical protein
MPGENEMNATDAGLRTPQPDRKSQGTAWWQNPTSVTILVAIVAAIPPLTTGVQAFFHSNNQLALEKSKQLHEMRQKYLDRFLSDVQNRRVLEFLVSVEEDPKLRSWAQKELNSTEQRIKSKEELYKETIAVVAKLANQNAAIDPQSDDYQRFWSFYNEKLLPVESRDVEAAMVAVGVELRRLSGERKPPSPALQDLSFRLASTMKRELPESAQRLP